MFYAIKLKAPNTPSGNPNRGWLVYTDRGNFIEFIAEGYLGYGALRQAGYGYADGAAESVKPVIILAEIPVASSVVNAARRGE